eukprot:COSAG05_NODE_3981_length_1740_cov_1.946374_2_plen_111_part_00
MQWAFGNLANEAIHKCSSYTIATAVLMIATLLLGAGIAKTEYFGARVHAMLVRFMARRRGVPPHIALVVQPTPFMLFFFDRHAAFALSYVDFTCARLTCYVGQGRSVDIH